MRSVIAVSGGPDSVAMLRAIVELGQQSSQWNPDCLIVGHLNHATRGSESDLDARFVQQLADQLGLPFRLLEVDAKLSVSPSEETLRNVRYQRLIQLAQSEGARYLATGHNCDDQIETILFRIFRGTGIQGLTGIPRQRLASPSLTLVRPMLGIRRFEIEDYLAGIGQSFRHDASNRDSRYSRNFLRNEIIPELTAKFGRSVPDAILRLSVQAQEIDDYLLVQTQQFDDSILERTPDKLVIDCQALGSGDLVVVRRWLMEIWKQQAWPQQAMSFQWWQTIAHAVQSTDCVVHNLPGAIRLTKGERQAEFLHTG